MSVDGTDIPIYEPSPFTPSWFSFKLNGPGLIYEVGLSIFKNKILWINGPFCPGNHNELQIFQRDLRFYLNDSETVCAYRIYRDFKCVRKGDVMI